MALKQEGKSSSKKGIIFVLFIIIAIAGLGGYFYFFHMDKGETEVIEMPVEESVIQVEEAKDTKGVTALVKDTLMEQQAEKRSKIRYHSKKAIKGYYVRVASCQYSSCTHYNKALLNKRRFPVIAVNKTGSTQYYHLISAMAFKKAVAERKAMLLAGLNKMPGNPTVVPHKNLYRISMGFFPERDKGLYMQSYVDQFQSHTKTYFSLERKIERFKYTNIYAGPFLSKKKADQVFLRLQTSREFYNLEVIKNPKRDNRAIGIR